MSPQLSRAHAMESCPGVMRRPLIARSEPRAKIAQARPACVKSASASASCPASLVDGFWAPVKPTWGLDNRTASFRVIAGSPKATRLETRCPGADVNPYLAMAAVIAAGLHGVEQG